MYRESSSLLLTCRSTLPSGSSLYMRVTRSFFSMPTLFRSLLVHVTRRGQEDYVHVLEIERARAGLAVAHRSVTACVHSSVQHKHM